MRVDFLGVEHRLVVPRGTTIRGRVVDGVTGAPLGDVELEPDTGVRTDLEGRFSVAGHPTDGGALLATRPGYAPTVIVGGAPGADGVVEVVVPVFPESVISGIVLDERSEPVEGVEVAFEHEGDLEKWFAIPARYPHFDWERLWVKDPDPYPLPRTGTDGRFCLRVKPISDAVRVTATDDVSGRVFTHPPIALSAAGSERFIELRPYETGTVTGTVEPSCEGWSVELVRDGSRDSVASIDPDGTFTFERVRTGLVAIRLWQDERRLDERDVLVRAGETSSLRFVVDRGPQGAIAGIVRRPDGSPLAGATVRASEPVGETRQGKTDVGGRFRVELHARPGEDVRVDCAFDGLERATAASLGEEGLMFVLPETRPTHLSVVDHESGESVGGFIVRWRWLDDSSAEPLEGASKFEPAIEHDEPPLSLPVGVVSLTIDASWIGYEPLTVDRLEVPAGSGVLSHEYRLRQTAATEGADARPAAASDEG